MMQAEALPGQAPPLATAPSPSGAASVGHRARAAPPLVDDGVFKILISTDNHLVREK
jgi:hypothetical protein